MGRLRVYVHISVGEILIVRTENIVVGEVR